MGIGVGGDHLLRVKLGDTDIPLTPGVIHEIIVTEYLDKFLPSIRFEVSDAEGILTHMIPFDADSNKLKVLFKSFLFEGEYEAVFDIYRREPSSGMQTSGVFSCTGLLHTDNLFAPAYERGWSTKTLKEILTQIAIEDLGCDEIRISDSLEVVKPIIQPLWTNAQFFVYMQRFLYGSDVGGFYTHVIVDGIKKVLMVYNVKDMLEKSTKTVYVTNALPVEDARPLFEFEIIDNYKLSQLFGTVGQTFGSFNFESGVYASGSLDLDEVDFQSLTEYFLVDKSDGDAGLLLKEGPRLTDFVEDYEPVFIGRFHKRLLGLTKMWGLVEGNQNIHPGQIVKIVFIQGSAVGNLFSYQYAGCWLVERVVHWFGTTYRSKLLLTRNGVDTDKSTSLVPAKYSRKT